MKLNEKDIKAIARNVVGRLVNEATGPRFFTEDDFRGVYYREADAFKEYCQDYPNGGFSPRLVTRDDLIRFCRSFGDFNYIYDTPIKGWDMMVASTENVQQSIVGDLMRAEITPSHKFDWMIEYKKDFEHDYVAVFNIRTEDEDYYIIYEQPK